MFSSSVSFPILHFSSIFPVSATGDFWFSCFTMLPREICAHSIVCKRDSSLKYIYFILTIKNLYFCYAALFSQVDSTWVQEELLPELELKQPQLRACLHHRDFQVSSISQRDKLNRTCCEGVRAAPSLYEGANTSILSRPFFLRSPLQVKRSEDDMCQFFSLFKPVLLWFNCKVVENKLVNMD